MSDGPILKCSNVTKSFATRSRRIDVLRGIDLEVNPGEVIIIKGRSGEGKTVLQWILSGIDSPSSGEILFQGRSFGDLSSEELAKVRREKIGLIFQNFNLIQSWTALENVESALINSDLSARDRKKKATDILTRMGLKERLDNLPVELSEGQQQRVALARALINEPSLIIADEPTGNVDEETASDMISIVLPYIREKGGAIVVTTHGAFSEMQLGDSIYELRNGRLLRNH